MSVREVDRGSEALFRRLDQRTGVRVGVIGSDAMQAHKERDENGEEKSGDLTVIDVATKHEYGLGVPKRSFIRDYVDENEGRLKQYVRNVGKRIMAGESAEKAFNAFGVVVVGEIRTRISNHISPPNSQKTIDWKGSDTPLIGVTGQLWSSITHAVDGTQPHLDGKRPPGVSG